MRRDNEQCFNNDNCVGGKYFMTPSGELLIEEVNRNDSSSTFRCRTVNRLTGETQLSENSGRLQLSGNPITFVSSPISQFHIACSLILGYGRVSKSSPQGRTILSCIRA
jgi:hypothetical protein